MKPIYPDNLSDPMSDENLVLLTLAGDTSAYDRLVLRWETAVVNAALSVCRNRELARDAAQDAFVTAWIKLAHLANGAKYGAWTCKIARNCALQLLTRYRYYTGEISTDDENAAYALEDPYAVDPARSSAKKAERESVHTAIDTLPERVRLIIRLYYLENHSIEEIAERLGVTSGTVKKQLWDGRRKIRKELCAMDETMQDTLLERVHKKVEEVKAWQYLDKKEGFATVYHDALAMIEELPESGERLAKGKYHAMADVLMCGWWWLPGEQNDALFARIREAAFAGGNEDVIAEVMARERQGLWESGLWNYIKEKQIPELAKAGYNKALAQTYFWLGTDMCFTFSTGICFNADEDVKEEGKAALEKAITISGVDDPFHAHAKAALDMENAWEEKYKDESVKAYRTTAGNTELCLRDGVWRVYREIWSETGQLNSVSIEADYLFHNMAADCDHYLIKPDLAVGETWYSSAGTRLTHVSDSETVETPCGTFENCSLWEKENREARVRTWLRDGVGIVRQEYTVAGFTDTRQLSEYHICGGTGLLPLAAGNRWSYDGGYNPEMLCHFCTYTVAYADTERANVTMRREYHRLGYDTNDFYDTMAKARNAYCDYNQGAGYQVDQSETMRRAEELAKTPFEIAYAASANDVLRRIQSCRNGLPENKNNMGLPIGRWNFFDFVSLYKDKRKTRMNRDFRRSFEWKSDREGPGEALLMNGIMELLSNTDDNCVWDEEWETPGSRTRKYLRWGDPVCAKITTEDIGEYTVRVGTFADCKRLTVTITGFQSGYDYANGTRTYILAPGIGILSVTNPYADDTCTATYELTAYTGVGEGYMPFFSGMERTYTAIDLTDGMVAWSKFHCMTADSGDLILLSDRCGMEEPIRVTRFGSIEREQRAEMLSGADAHLRRQVNTLHIFAHMISYPVYESDPYRIWIRDKVKLDAFRSLAIDGEVPQGWWQIYASRLFSSACHYFGAILTSGEAKEKLPLEEGYRMLEEGISLYRRWIDIPDGTLLPLGHEALFGNAKLIKGKFAIELPDGTRELLDFGADFHAFGRDPEDLYAGMTATRGWEWFNGVRNDERFQKDVALAKDLMDAAAKQGRK